MRNKFSPLAIGMFVLVGTAILVAGIMVFGAAKFFTDTEMLISYFSESVNGLDVGAPVKYKGVLIGKVENIRISASKKNAQESAVGIVYSIDLDMFNKKTRGNIVDFRAWLDEQIKEGLRAKLNYQSIVTGMLYIELDYLAEKDEAYEITYSGFNFIEIPGKKSGLAEMGKAIQKSLMNFSRIDFKSIADNANASLIKINQKLDDLDVKSLNLEIVKTLASADALLKNSNALVSSPEVSNLAKNANELISESKNTLADVDKLLVSSESLVEKFNVMLAPHSPFRFEIALMLRNLNESMSSISNFMEYLQRNPSSLLTGKAKSESEKQHETSK